MRINKNIRNTSNMKFRDQIDNKEVGNWRKPRWEKKFKIYYTINKIQNLL